MLHHDPGLKVAWNQIHLCELEAEGFDGFGREFAAALREDPHASDISGIFAGLDRIRTVPAWTLNDPVIEADAALAQEGRAETRSQDRVAGVADAGGRRRTATSRLSHLCLFTCLLTH